MAASHRADLTAAEMLRRGVLLLVAVLLLAVAHSPLAYASEADHKVPPFIPTLDPNTPSLGWIRRGAAPDLDAARRWGTACLVPGGGFGL